MVPYTIKRWKDNGVSKKQFFNWCFERGGARLSTFCFRLGGGDHVCPLHAEVIQWRMMILL
jgi:hypothetical protein